MSSYYQVGQLVWVFYDQAWWVAQVLDAQKWTADSGSDPLTDEQLAENVAVMFVEDGSADLAYIGNTSLFDTVNGPNDIDPAHENTRAKIADLIAQQEALGIGSWAAGAGDLDTSVATFSQKYDTVVDEHRRQHICTDAIPILASATTAVAPNFQAAYDQVRTMCTLALSAFVNRTECCIFAARVARLFVPIISACQQDYEGSEYAGGVFYEFVTQGVELIQHFQPKPQGGSKHMMELLRNLTTYHDQFVGLHRRLTEIIAELQFTEYVPARVSRGPSNSQMLKAHEVEVAQCVKASMRMKVTNSIKETIEAMKANLKAAQEACPPDEAGTDNAADSSLVAPALDPLPPGWAEATTDEGYTYYYNEATGQQTWDRDEAMMAGRESAAATASGGAGGEQGDVTSADELARILMDVSNYPPGKCGPMSIPTVPPMTYFDGAMLLLNERKHKPLGYFTLGRCVANTPNKIKVPSGHELDEKALYKEAIRYGPTMAWGYIGLGTSMTNGEPETIHDGRRFLKKKECFLEAIKCDPRNSFAFNALGVAITQGKTATLHDGRKMDKMDCYMEALRVDPKCARAFYNIGADMINNNSVVTVNGHKLTAKECYIRCVRLDPNNAPAFNNIGNILADGETFELSGRHMGKRDCHLEALRIDPTFTYAIFNLAVSMRDDEEIVHPVDGRTMSKMDLFVEVLNINPNNDKALARLKALLLEGETMTLNNGTVVKGTRVAGK